MYTHTQEHYDPDFLQTKKNLYETKKSNLNKATAACEAAVEYWAAPGGEMSRSWKEDPTGMAHRDITQIMPRGHNSDNGLKCSTVWRLSHERRAPGTIAPVNSAAKLSRLHR